MRLSDRFLLKLIALLRLIIIVVNGFIFFRELMVIAMGGFWFLISLAGEGHSTPVELLSFVGSVAAVFICSAGYAWLSVFLIRMAVRNHCPEWAGFLALAQVSAYFLMIRSDYLSLPVEEMLLPIAISSFSTLTFLLLRRSAKMA